MGSFLKICHLGTQVGETGTLKKDIKPAIPQCQQIQRLSV